MTNNIVVAQVRYFGDEDDVFLFSEDLLAEDYIYDYFEYTRDEFPHIDELPEHLSAQDIGYFSIYYRSVDENIYASKISKVFS